MRKISIKMNIIIQESVNITLKKEIEFTTQLLR